MIETMPRSTATVRLIGPAAASPRWRKALIAEGLAVPASGACSVCFADLSGLPALGAEIAAAMTRARVEPLVVSIGITDPLPEAVPPGVVIVRHGPFDAAAAARMLRRTAARRTVIDAASVRFRAFARINQPFPVPRADDRDTPVALLSEPGPSVLPLLRRISRREMIAPLTSSQTLRLLESRHASALAIHLTGEREHRLPVLKLIRRQSELQGLPVAVIAPSWNDEAAGQWLTAGADLLAHPDEVPAVLAFLREASARHQIHRTVRQALTQAAISDEGDPSPVFGRGVFEKVVAEHLAQGDPVAYGAIELTPGAEGGEDAVSEAGVYMTLAMSPLDLVFRASERVFVVAMPHADRLYARRTMRTLQTLVEDLKFGEEPESVLISARHTTLTGSHDAPAEVTEQLMRQLAREAAAVAFA